MNAVVFFIEQIATGLYILLGVALVVAWLSFTRARRAYRSTQFELERDMARDQQTNAVTTLILLLEAVLLVFGMQRVVAPAIRATLDPGSLAAVVASDGEFRTPTPAPVSGVVIDASGVVINEDLLQERILATPTLTPTPVGTIIANAPAVVGCDTESATLQVPANGMVVFEPIPIIGIAATEDFAFYRFELNGPSTFGNFAPIGERTQPVNTIGELGQFVPAFYEPGEYQFRLQVFDVTNTARASCTVNIFISDPIPTPTPLAAELPS